MNPVDCLLFCATFDPNDPATCYYNGTEYVWEQRLWLDYHPDYENGYELVMCTLWCRDLRLDECWYFDCPEYLNIREYQFADTYP